MTKSDITAADETGRRKKQQTVTINDRYIEKCADEIGCTLSDAQVHANTWRPARKARVHTGDPGQLDEALAAGEIITADSMEGPLYNVLSLKAAEARRGFATAFYTGVTELRNGRR